MYPQYHMLLPSALLALGGKLGHSSRVERQGLHYFTFFLKKAACLAQELEPQWNESHCASTGLRYRRSIQFEGEEGTAIMSHSVSLLCTLLRTIIRTHFSALENKGRLRAVPQRVRHLGDGQDGGGAGGLEGVHE